MGAAGGWQVNEGDARPLAQLPAPGMGGGFAVEGDRAQRRQSLALGGWLVLFLVIAVGAVIGGFLDRKSVV